MIILDFLDSEWQPWPSAFQAYSKCLFLALQEVSGCCGSLHSKPSDDAFPWLSSLWVSVMAHFISSPVTIPVLNSSGSESLSGLAWFQAVQCLFLAVQEVSGWLLNLLHFKLTDDACHWLPRMWVATMTCCHSCLLIMPVFGSSVCEWPLWLAAFQAYWQSLSLAL